MLQLDEFIKKNNLEAESDDLRIQMQEKLDQQQLIGFQSRGPVAGLVSAQLQAVGMNTIFPNGIYVSCYHEEPCEELTLHLIPKVIAVGVECDEEADANEMSQAVEEMMKERNFFKQTVGMVATIDKMAEMDNLKELANTYGANLFSYTADELKQVEGMFSIGEPQDVCYGVDKVSERACVRASENGELLIRRKEFDHFTLAVAMKQFVVEF